MAERTCRKDRSLSGVVCRNPVYCPWLFLVDFAEADYPRRILIVFTSRFKKFEIQDLFRLNCTEKTRSFQRLLNTDGFLQIQDRVKSWPGLQGLNSGGESKSIQFFKARFLAFIIQLFFFHAQKVFLSLVVAGSRFKQQAGIH